MRTPNHEVCMSKDEMGIFYIYPEKNLRAYPGTYRRMCIIQQEQRIHLKMQDCNSLYLQAISVYKNF